MMKTSFAKVAIFAAREAQKTADPIMAWEYASIKVFGKGTWQQLKRCPKNTFLGLCEEGIIKGIPKGKYTRSVKNKTYALTAVRILNNEKHISSAALWKEVMIALNENSGKQHNGQMDVVLALADNKLIIYK